ncbi:MAG: DeoR/GlpR family DNA-binding transcription regulator [Propionibacteriaceae bacterium]|nr:DeoR/GlpR family DNA-binding transcription regulator [Propionibacteriaceae bacterium]
MADRQTQLLEYVIEHERVDVAALSERFGVSQVTIRKDLDQLESRGLVKREHGYAVAPDQDNLLGRMAYHYENKLSIATTARSLVSPGATVMIESGSCCALLAEQLAGQGTQIITNSSFIARLVGERTQVVLLGGDFQASAEVCVGPMVAEALAAFHVSDLFIGIDGFTLAGFTGRNHLRAAVVQEMATRAERVTVLSESAKFGRLGAVSLLPTTSVQRVVTDAALASNEKKSLVDAGVEVLLADS